MRPGKAPVRIESGIGKILAPEGDILKILSYLCHSKRFERRQRKARGARPSLPSSVRTRAGGKVLSLNRSQRQVHRENREQESDGIVNADRGPCAAPNRRIVRPPQGALLPVRDRNVGALLLLRDARAARP